MGMRCSCVWAAVCVAATVHAELPVVVGGRPAAVVVVPAEALPVTRYAAEELAFHVQRATGAVLEIAGEGAVPAAPVTRLYVGPTQAALAAGIDIAALGPEDCRLLVRGGAGFIVGRDTAGDPLAQDTRAGSLWGVYELVERLLEARWLWPGDLGLSIRRTDSLTVPPWDEVIRPSLLQRNVRPGLRRTGGSFPGFSEEGLARYSRAQQVFLRRHRMGRSMPLRYGHAFTGWWASDGETHPEWFQLLADGRRGPSAPGRQFSMCVSNPEFHAEVIRRWREARAANPDGPRNVNGTENDIGGLCTCPNCLAWDGPQTDEGSDIYAGLRDRRVSDRYARFWLALHTLAVAEDPGAMVMGYAYINYYPKPSEAIALNPNILIGMCPWPGMWYPRSAREQAWLKEQWQGWARTGASVFYRPNTTLDGYAMPHAYARQFADEFQFYARNSMVATDFDSLTGQWAAQGPTLYTLVRLHVRPQLDFQEVLSEYYRAFGPAADLVRAYFDYWESYTTENRTRLEETLARNGASRYRQYAKAVADAYPPECFAPAEALLARAEQAAAGEPLSAARVGFVRKGLVHAKLCRDLSAAMMGTAGASPMAARRALDKLRAFRAEVEGDFVANYLWCTSVEERSYTLPSGWNGEALVPAAPRVAPLAADVLPIPLRGQATVVAILKAGEPFLARLENRRLGRNPDPAAWRLFGPDDAVLASGEIPVGESADLAVPAKVAGVHLLEVHSKGNVLRALLGNDHAAAAATRLAMASAPVRLHVAVPAAAQRFSLVLQTPSPGETASLRVFAPDGREVAAGTTEAAPRFVAAVEVPPGQAGRAWLVQVDKASNGVLEDFTLELDASLPAYWSHAPDRLVLPAGTPW